MHLFGYGRIMQAVGPGMHGLGQIRLFFEGEVLVYCCPFRDIQKYLMTLIPAADGGHSVVGLPAVRRWAAGATQEALEATRKNGDVLFFRFHAISPAVLRVPCGWICFEKVGWRAQEPD